MSSSLIFVCLVWIPPCLWGFQFIFQPGPLFPASQGAVWPKPQHADSVDDKYFTVLPFFFSFKSTGNRCETLDKAIERYKYITNYQNRFFKEIYYPTNTCYGYDDANFQGYLFSLDVHLKGPCNDSEYPSIHMKEDYILNVTADVQKLSSESMWGILRGLETFSQLIYLTADYSCFRLDTVNIHDYPRFPHRGLMLDTARHYHSPQNILKLLDAMSYNKLNVFHWHLSDDFSFPFTSRSFPNMSLKGAFHPKLMVYEPSFVQEVQEYGRQRGIRVIAEFNTPGHTLAWGLGQPDLLTECVGLPQARYGPVDPSKDATYRFIYKFYEEIKSVFRDEYVHLGGDDVDHSCWKSNPNITKFMSEYDIEGDYVALQTHYTQKLINYVSSLYLKSIVWEEAFTNGVDIPEKSIIHVWKNVQANETLAKITKSGHNVIVSSFWYLDILNTGGDWLKFHQADPADFEGDEEQKRRVLGAEVCMWSEVVDDMNLEPRVWPRASAAAERFWSAPSSKILNPTIEDLWPIAQRLEEQTCRMKRRGVRAQPPTGPSVCF